MYFRLGRLLTFPYSPVHLLLSFELLARNLPTYETRKAQNNTIIGAIFASQSRACSGSETRHLNPDLVFSCRHVPRIPRRLWSRTSETQRRD